MKEDILEQVVDDYLQARGYFTRHNIKFKPRSKHRAFAKGADSVSSDIDVIGVNPHRRGAAKVWVVTCKSWQIGFNARSRLKALRENKIVGGREFWRAFRELVKPKWSEAFRAAVFRETGAHRFTYVIAVTSLSDDRKLWEDDKRFRWALRGNPIKLITMAEIAAEILGGITKTPASSDTGRTLQLLRASGFLGGAKR
jgi:hypothetical protein